MVENVRIKETKKVVDNFLSNPPNEDTKGAVGAWDLYVDRVNEWAWSENVFSVEECKEIIDINSRKQTYQGIAGKKVDKKYRDSTVVFMSPENSNEWIFRRMTDVVNSMNNNFFGFDLTSISEGLQFTEYKTLGSHYSWHIDKQHGEKIRKLSFSILLSDPNDFSGGELQFKFGEKNVSPNFKQGMCIAFPSYVLHRVSPVTEGKRFSLVTWVTGPSFK